MSVQWRAGRLFSVAQANAVVPFLTTTFERVAEIRSTIAAHVAALQAAGHPVDETLLEEPSGDESPDIIHHLAEVRALHALIMGLLDEITGLGIEVKAIDGLADVRARYDGRIVHLCWGMGETRFSHWHELDTGFAGRRPIEDPEAFEGQLLN